VRYRTDDPNDELRQAVDDTVGTERASAIDGNSIRCIDSIEWNLCFTNSVHVNALHGRQTIANSSSGGSAQSDE
jgi:hypothetical protein